MSGSVIEIEAVRTRFGAQRVHDGVDLVIARGELVALVGGSGSGKSVLLREIIGLQRPDAGRIRLLGTDVWAASARELTALRRRIGVMFQDGALFGSMDIYDNIAFPLREHTKRSETEIRKVVESKAEMIGLARHLDKLPGEISGGMRKRAGLARALALDPEIVFFDEPDSGLDPVRVAHLDEMVKEVQAEVGCTFFIITHNIESVKRTADYVGMLFRSNLVGFGPTNDLVESQDPLLKQFFSGSARGPIGMDEMVDAEGDPEDLLSTAGLLG